MTRASTQDGRVARRDVQLTVGAQLRGEPRHRNLAGNDLSGETSIIENSHVRREVGRRVDRRGGRGVGEDRQDQGTDAEQGKELREATNRL